MWDKIRCLLPGIYKFSHLTAWLPQVEWEPWGFGLPAGIGAKIGRPDKAVGYIRGRWRSPDDNTGNGNNSAI